MPYMTSLDWRPSSACRMAAQQIVQPAPCPTIGWFWLLAAGLAVGLAMQQRGRR